MRRWRRLRSPPSYLLLLFCVSTVFSEDLTPPMTPIMARVFKFIFENDRICGDAFGDPNWLPAMDRCHIRCDFTSEICLENTQHGMETCRSLPWRCVKAMQVEIWSEVMGKSSDNDTKRKRVSPPGIHPPDETKDAPSFVQEPPPVFAAKTVERQEVPSVANEDPYAAFVIPVEAELSATTSAPTPSPPAPPPEEGIVGDQQQQWYASAEASAPPPNVVALPFTYSPAPAPSQATDVGSSQMQINGAIVDETGNWQGQMPNNQVTFESYNSKALQRDEQKHEESSSRQEDLYGQAVTQHMEKEPETYLPPNMQSGIALAMGDGFEEETKTTANPEYRPMMWTTATRRLSTSTTYQTHPWTTTTTPAVLILKPTRVTPVVITHEQVHVTVDPFRQQQFDGSAIDQSVKCCEWAIDGLCDRHWQKVRVFCPKSCGTLICQEEDGTPTCSRVIDVDVVECYKGSKRGKRRRVHGSPTSVAIQKVAQNQLRTSERRRKTKSERRRSSGKPARFRHSLDTSQALGVGYMRSRGYVAVP